MKKISTQVLAALSAAVLDGPTLRLTGQLDRKLYVETNKVIEAAGGKWSKSLKAHVFSGSAEAYIEDILLTGEYATPKQDFGQFDTPLAIAQMVIDRAEITDGMRVLEPSVGLGQLLIPLIGGPSINLRAFDTDQDRAFASQDVLRQIKGTTAFSAKDFLTERANAVFDRVVMNPPFAKGADIAHVRHAYDFLKPGGRLVAIMSPGFTFRQDRKFAEFRDWSAQLDAKGEALPENSFKESGTGVNTVILTINKPA